MPEEGHPLRRLFVEIYTDNGESSCEPLVNGELEPLDEKHPCRVEYVSRTSSVNKVVRAANLLVCDVIPKEEQTSSNWANYNPQSSCVMGRKDTFCPRGSETFDAAVVEIFDV